MGTLSEKLKRLYARKGKRIVFSNGATLNQLALLMWDKEKDSGVDPSVLSRVINGRRLFTGKQLKVFCETLGLSPEDHKNLVYALRTDWMERLDIPAM